MSITDQFLIILNVNGVNSQMHLSLGATKQLAKLSDSCYSTKLLIQPC